MKLNPRIPCLDALHCAPKNPEWSSNMPCFWLRNNETVLCFPKLLFCSFDLRFWRRRQACCDCDNISRELVSNFVILSLCAQGGHESWWRNCNFVTNSQPPATTREKCRAGAGFYKAQILLQNLRFDFKTCPNCPICRRWELISKMSCLDSW